jgi:hypothetical protein
VRCAAGAVVGNRYRILEPLPAGEARWDVHAAASLEGGAGRVRIRSLRPPPDLDLATMRAQRAWAEHMWDAWCALARDCPSTVPMPLERVHMVPLDAGVRQVWRAGAPLAEVAREPWLVGAETGGLPLSTWLEAPGATEDTWLLQGLLRWLRMVHRWLARGWLPVDVTPEALSVHPLSHNVCLEEPWALAPGEAASDDARRRALQAVHRVAATWLGGMRAPDWGVEQAADWARWCTSRRIPPEQGAVLALLRDPAPEAEPPDDDLGASCDPALSRACDAAAERVRGLVGQRRSRVWRPDPLPPDQKSPLPEGWLLQERWRVEAPFARGGRGWIHTVTDTWTGCGALLKTNHYEYDAARAFLADLPLRRAELRHEYEVLRRFAPLLGTVPSPLTLGEGEGQGAWFAFSPGHATGEPFLVMERLSGVPLLGLLPSPRMGLAGARVPDNRLPAAWVVAWMARLARLLAVLHDEGFLFQDLKTDNLLYDPATESVQLVDLAAVCPRKADGRLDEHHIAFGMQTHGFAAPEFRQRWDRTDLRFDLYSLGAVAFHLLTGVNPERYALELGEESPPLPLALLADQPATVRELVARCLAPLEERWPDAHTLARAADTCRLGLSRVRPLDVDQAALVWAADRVRLAWERPADPRLRGLRVVRHEAGVAPRVVHDGPWLPWVEDALPTAGAPVQWVVQTMLQRGDHGPTWSRGVVLTGPARVPPLAWEARAGFGVHHLSLRRPPHASAVVVRRHHAVPPATPDEGDPVGAPFTDDTLTLTLPADPGVATHYAAFACYAQGHSMPRAATLQALPPLPAMQSAQATASADAVHLRWSPPLDNAVLGWEARDGTGIHQRLLPPRASSADLTGLPPDCAMRWWLELHLAGQVSPPLAEGEARTWPAIPAVEVQEGPGRLTLRAPGASPSIVHWRWVGQGVIPLPAVIPLPTGPHALTLVPVFADGSEGPPQTVAGTVMAWSNRPALAVVDPVMPARLALQTPPPAPGLRLRLWTDAAVEHRADLGDGEPWSPAMHVEPGVPVCLQAAWVWPDGGLGDRVELAWTPLRRLAPPAVTPGLGSLRVAPVEPDAPPWSLQLDPPHAGTLPEGPHHGPIEVALPAGRTVTLRIRWQGEGPPMPWSDPVEARSLAPPDAPRALTGTPLPDGALWLRWQAGQGEPAQHWEVWREDGPGVEVCIHRGTACEAVDGAPPASSARWWVQGVAHGLTGARASWEAPMSPAGATPPARRKVPAGETAPTGGPAGSATPTTGQPMGGASVGRIEVSGVLPAPRWRRAVAACAVVAPQAGERCWVVLAGEDPPVGADALHHPRVLARVRSPRVRTILAWRAAPGPTTLWEVAPGVGDGLRWHPVGALDGGPLALVGLATPRVERLQLVPVGRPLGAGHPMLRIWDRQARARTLVLDEMEPLRPPGAAGGAGLAAVGTQLDGACGLGIQARAGDVARLGVPLTSWVRPDQVGEALWADRAADAVRTLADGMMVLTGGAPVSRADAAREVLLSLLVAGAPVEWHLRWDRLTRDGQVRLAFTLRATCTGGEGRRWVRLDEVQRNPVQVLRHLLHSHALLWQQPATHLPPTGRPFPS